MLYRRGKIWWVKLSGHGSGQIRESARTTDRQAAQEYHDHRAAELWRERQLGERPRVAFSQAAANWLTTHSAGKRSAEADRLRMRHMLPLIPEIPLDRIDTAFMTTLRDRLMKTRTVRAGKIGDVQTYRPIAKATANKYLAILSAILHHAHRRGWLTAVPHVPMFPPAAKRAIPIMTPADVLKVLDALPPHLRPMAVFALATGQRQANVRDLRWSNVDLARRVAILWGDETKAGNEIPIPLSDDAVAVLKAQLGLHPVSVFTYQRGKNKDGTPKRRPIAGGLSNTAWQRARAAAGFPTLRWHDLRHIWATWHAAAGTPLLALQTMGGWRDARMVNRYTHLAALHLLEHANTVRVPVNPGHSVETGGSEEVTAEAESANAINELVGVADGIRTHDNWNHKADVIPISPAKSTTKAGQRRAKTGGK